MSDENLEVDYVPSADRCTAALKGFLPLFYSRISEEVFHVYCGLGLYWGGAIRTLRLALRETDRAQFLASNHEIFGLSMHILVNLVFVT